MPFTDEEAQSLLAVKGIGKTVLQRLRQMGLDDITKLADCFSNRSSRSIFRPVPKYRPNPPPPAW